MSTSVKQLMLSLPKQIPIQLLLMWPATTFFDSQMKKKTCLKQ